MKLEDLVTPAAVTAAIGVAGAAIAKLVTIIQLPHEECKAEKVLLRQQLADREAQIKALQLEVRDLLIHSSALRRQNDKLSGRDSDRP